MSENIIIPVSYTHLDVYKRQVFRFTASCGTSSSFFFNGSSLLCYSYHYIIYLHYRYVFIKSDGICLGYVTSGYVTYTPPLKIDNLRENLIF